LLRFLLLTAFNLAVWVGLVFVHAMPDFPMSGLQTLRTATGVLFGLPLGWLVLVDDGLWVFVRPGEPVADAWPPFGALLLPNSLLWATGVERLIHRFYDPPETD